MGVFLEIVDLDELFHSQSTVPTILNDINIKSTEDRENLQKRIYTKYEGDTLDIVPSCYCRAVRGRFNQDVLCKICNTRVQVVTEEKLEAALWIAAPKGVRALISPQVWLIFTKQFSITGCNLLLWLTNASYVPRNPNNPLLLKLHRLGVHRGLNNFIDNFDNIISILFSSNVIKAKNREVLAKFISMNRNKLFPSHIPVPSRLTFITETTVTGVYADTSMEVAMDAVHTITSIESAVIPLKQVVREQRTVKALSQLAQYYMLFYSKSLSTKHGWFRKHTFGSRLHFSFRAVISSITVPHDYDEVHMPWSLSTQLFSIHLTNKLSARGYTPSEASKFIADNSQRYNPLLAELFRELIAESPYKGIPIILQRNPTLVRLSAQLLYITCVKENVEINTISMSPLALKGPNAD